MPEQPLDEMDDFEDDGFCLLCGDDFRYDDCGGYNPPCSCGLHCRGCHEFDDDSRVDCGDDDEDDYCYDCGRQYPYCECERGPTPIPSPTQGGTRDA